MSDLQKLDNELCSIRPVEPPAGFESRLEKALGEPGNVALRCVPETDAVTEPVSSVNAGKVVPFILSPLMSIAAVAAVVTFALYFAYPLLDYEAPPNAKSIVAKEESQTVPTMPEVDVSPLHGVSAAAFAALSGEGWSAPDVKETLLEATDDGIVDRPGQAPARRYLYRYLDETTWRHPDTNTLIRSSVPREEVVLIGMELY